MLLPALFVLCLQKILRWLSSVQSCMVQEIQLLRKLSFDRNIVQFYGACLQEENTMMVLEYMEV